MSQNLLTISRSIAQLCFALLFGLWNTQSIAEANISIDDPRIDASPEFFRLTTDIHFDLPEQALEALNNGVPITLVIETEVKDPDAWFWQKPLESYQLRYRLRYHALARIYQASDLGTQENRNFQTLQAALRFIGSLRNYPITRIEQLTNLPDSQFRMRVYLDIEALPLPLRSIAYMTPDWHISSDWINVPMISPTDDETSTVE